MHSSIVPRRLVYACRCIFVLEMTKKSNKTSVWKVIDRICDIYFILLQYSLVILCTVLPHFAIWCSFGCPSCAAMTCQVWSVDNVQKYSFMCCCAKICWHFLTLFNKKLVLPTCPASSCLSNRWILWWNLIWGNHLISTMHGCTSCGIWGNFHAPVYHDSLITSDDSDMCPLPLCHMYNRGVLYYVLQSSSFA